jgi:hypothetical protein
MSQQYDNRDRGALFKNDRKETENHPDYTGQINVGGVDYWLSAWIKEGRSGKFMSLSIKPKDERKPAQSRQAPPPRRRGDDDDDGDIPF